MADAPITPWTAARNILETDPNLPSAVVIERLAARGMKIKSDTIHGVRKKVKAKAAKSGAVPLPTSKPAPKPAAPASGYTGVLANVSLVDQVAGLSGGIANARQVAEAVRACGGVDGFLKVLDLVAGIKKEK